MDKRIAIHGLGYVGLTAAVHWARAGWTVYAYDADPAVVRALAAGTPRSSEFLSYLNDDVARLIDGLGCRPGEGAIIPVQDFETTTLKASVHSIAIPTERAGVPWTDGIAALMKRLHVGLRRQAHEPHAVILVESTMPPGATDMIMGRIRGSRKPDDAPPIHVAICPRRDWFADASKSLESLERVVGGVTPEATDIAASLLSNVTKATIHRCGYREAEFTKALENAWLHSLVMLPTELAVAVPGVDIARVTELASTHWRLPAIHLGAGCGGRCVPLGTKYLLGTTQGGGVLDAVDRAESSIRFHVAEAIARRLPRPASVLVLGAAYRPDFRDAGLSPGLSVARSLRNDFGLEVHVFDPMWSQAELSDLTGFYAPPVLAPEGYDAVFLATPHTAFLDLPGRLAPAVDWDDVRVVFDAQGTWRRFATLFAQRGIEYTHVGAAGWR